MKLEHSFSVTNNCQFVSSEVSIVVTMKIPILRDIMRCSLVEFTNIAQERASTLFSFSFCHEDGENTFLQTVVIYLPDYTVPASQKKLMFAVSSVIALRVCEFQMNTKKVNQHSPRRLSCYLVECWTRLGRHEDHSMRVCFNISNIGRNNRLTSIESLLRPLVHIAFYTAASSWFLTWLKVPIHV